MIMTEYGSIHIQSPEMLATLKAAGQLRPTDLIFIVGTKKSGKLTLAHHIQRNLFKDSSILVQRGLTGCNSNIQSGIFTANHAEWSEFLPSLRGAAFKLLEMPSLADRKADLPLLAEFFLQVLSLMNDKPKVKLTEKALEKLLQYGWPGEFVELEAILEEAFLAADSGLIEPEFLMMGPLKSNVAIPIGMKLDELERKYILQTLYFVHQNRTKAAEILGISIRTLRNKINQYRVEGFI